MPNEIKINVAAKGAGLAKIEADAKKAGKEIGDSIQKGAGQAENASERASKKIRDDLEKVEKSGRDAGEGLASGLGDALDSVASSMGGALGDLGGVLEGGLGGVKAGALAAGAGLGALIVAGIEAEMAEDSIGGMIAAQNAGTAAEGRRLGDIVGDAFADGFGDSMEGVGEAASAALGKGLVGMDAPKEVIEEITEMAATAAQVTGQSADEVAGAIRVMLNTGLAGNVQQAFDLVVSGFQRGANAGGDLLDVLTRSSTNLKQFGLGGDQAIGVFIQALEAGAPSADAFTGALEELVGNANDGIPVFQQLGLGGKEFADALVGGGPKAAAALDTLLDRIRAIESPAERSRIMVQLFGEEATAMQDAILAVDPSSAAKEMKNFAGATEEAAQVIQDTTSFWDKLGRGISGVANNIGEFLDKDLLEGMPDVKGFLEEVNSAQRDFDATGTLDQLNALKEKYPELSDKIDAYVAQKKKEAAATEDTNASTQEYVRSLNEVIDATTQAGGKALDLSDAQISFHDNVAKASEAAKEFAGEGLTAAKDGFDLGTESGREMLGALNDVADGAFNVMESMKEQNATTQETQAFVQQARDQFLALADQMGLDAAAANLLADKLGLIPGNYAASVQLTGWELAYARAEALEQKLRQIPTNKQINLRVSTSGSGHYLAGLASGGVASAAELGAVYSSGLPYAAAGGAQGMATVIKDEQGPEITRMPNGSMVIPAGMSEMLMQGWAGGGGGSPVFVLGGPTDELGRAMLNWLRACVKNEYGGSATAALGQRTGA